MIDLRAARAEPERLRAAVARKGAGEAFDRLLEADARWRELVPQVDELRGRQKLQGKPTPEQVEELKQVKEDLKRLEGELAEAEQARDAALEAVPNPPHESVPDGETEEEAEVVREVGEHPQLAEPKDHLELARYDMERGARLSGSRFGYIVGGAALLSLALYRFALDRLVAEGFTPVLPPVLVREEAMYGTGFFPAEKSEYYEIGDDGLYLTGTSEVALAGLHMGEILEADELPLHYTAFSVNFRREAGAAGRDTRGMFRVHQFNKVEMFAYVRPERLVGRAGANPGHRGRAGAGARPSLPGPEHPDGRAQLRGGQALRHRGVVPEPGALPGDHLVLEHHRLPGPPARHPLPRRAGHRARAHAERHRGHRPLGARDPGELPGRRAGRAEAVRRARPDRAGLLTTLVTRRGAGAV